MNENELTRAERNAESAAIGGNVATDLMKQLNKMPAEERLAFSRDLEKQYTKDHPDLPPLQLDTDTDASGHTYLKDIKVSEGNNSGDRSGADLEFDSTTGKGKSVEVHHEDDGSFKAHSITRNLDATGEHVTSADVIMGKREGGAVIHTDYDKPQEL